MVGGSVSGNHSFINGWVATRKSTDPLDFIGDPVLLTNSNTTYYFELTSRGQAWGDYSDCSLDPCDKKTIWTIQQFCADTDVWGLQVAEVKFN